MNEGENTAELQKEKRTLSEYINCKLGITLVLFSNLYSVKISTIYAKWRTNRGRTDVRNAVFFEYMRKNKKGSVEKFNKL